MREGFPAHPGTPPPPGSALVQPTGIQGFPAPAIALFHKDKETRSHFSLFPPGRSPPTFSTLKPPNLPVPHSKESSDHLPLAPFQEVFLKFTQQPIFENGILTNHPYSICHFPIAYSASPLLTKFLRANMDEHRLFYAEAYTEAVLRLTDHDDAMYFRKGLLSREVSRDMDYDRQRDHAAHTLYNYLLGWFLFHHSKLITQHIKDHFHRRFSDDTQRSLDQKFGNIWPLASLLHDVGYIFEGGLSRFEINTQVPKAAKGAHYINDFFQTEFWRQISLHEPALRAHVTHLTGITPPHLNSESLNEISDSLRDLGDLSILREAILKERPDLIPLLPEQTVSLADSFTIWKSNYLAFQQPGMAQRITQLQRTHEKLLNHGLPKIGTRVLDHGITGALLLLLHSTTYFKLHFALQKHLAPASDATSHPESSQQQVSSGLNQQIEDRLLTPSEDEIHVYKPSWWWTAIVWATGAVALHNVQTMDPWPQDSHPTEPLAIDEDPLAYLGILVDLLQEWDRYTTSKTSIFSGQLPLSSNDVQIGVTNGLILIDYGDPSGIVQNKIKKDLNKALKDWDQIVQVR
jgi:hypothetical protein